MIGFDEASQLVAQHARPLSPIRNGLRHALGCVLAQDVVARTSQPPFTASAMDGYAVNATTFKPNEPYEVIGEVAAGIPNTELVVGDNRVARIFTGGALPQGADAVIIQENATRTDDHVTFSGMVQPRSNVRLEGQDFRAGDVLLSMGTVLGSRQIGLIAAANVAEFDVFQKPRISLLSTGNELRLPGADLQAGQIVGSNGFMLDALLHPAAHLIIDHGFAQDSEGELQSALVKCLDGKPDMLITTGGASVGDHDLVVPMLKSLGAEIIFWKVAMRPGKPVMMAKLGETLIFGLPGNPVSAYVTGSLFALPAALAMRGGAMPQWRTGFLTGDLPANGDREHFMRAQIESRNGQVWLAPEPQVDSAHLSSLTRSDALIRISPNADAAQTGDAIRYQQIG